MTFTTFAPLPMWALKHFLPHAAQKKTMSDMISALDSAAPDAALIAEQEQFRSVLKTVPSAMVIIDARGTITAFSASAERMFGYAAHEAIGLNIDILTPIPGRDAHGAFRERYFAVETSYITDGTRVLFARHRDGSLVPIKLWSGEFHDGPHPLFTLFYHDLTARLVLEQRMGEMRDEMLNVSRLSAMGQMAAALAHELNQPLAAAAYFIGAADTLLSDDANREQGRAMLRLGGEQVLRGAEIIRRMRALVIAEDLDMQMSPIAAIVEDAVAVAFLGEALSEFHLVYDFDPAADMVMANRVQIGQVFFNLLRNAMEELRKCPSTSRNITIASKVATADMIELSVADNGPGLDPSILDKPFKLFASTKPESGMGMGLSICQHIIEAHGGTFTAANCPGGGAVFRFTLFCTSREPVETRA